MAAARYLPVEPGIRLRKPLIAKRTQQAHIAHFVQLGRIDHRIEVIGQLLVEAGGERVIQHLHQCQAAHTQQHGDPHRSDQHHAPLQRAARAHRCRLRADR